MKDTIDTGKKVIWRNEFKTAIVAACFSCKYASNYSLDGQDKICQLDSKIFSRTHLCTEWEAKQLYKIIGGPRNLAGGLAQPGKIKTKRYIQWMVDNQKKLPGASFDKQVLYKDINPTGKVFYEDK